MYKNPWHIEPSTPRACIVTACIQTILGIYDEPFVTFETLHVSKVYWPYPGIALGGYSIHYTNTNGLLTWPFTCVIQRDKTTGADSLKWFTLPYAHKFFYLTYANKHTRMLSHGILNSKHWIWSVVLLINGRSAKNAHRYHPLLLVITCK